MNEKELNDLLSKLRAEYEQNAPLVFQAVVLERLGDRLQEALHRIALRQHIARNEPSGSGRPVIGDSKAFPR